MSISKRQLTAWGLLALAILLAIGWNQVPLADAANRHAMHDPVFCLRGAGWTIQSDTPTTIAHGTAHRLILGHGAESQAILAWYSDGTRAFSSPREAWLRTALRRMTFRASGMPITLVIIQFSPGLPPGPEFLDQLAGL